MPVVLSLEAQHNLAFNYPFPLAFTKAEGAYLYDADRNKYIDFLQAGGPTVLGSNYPSVREKCIELINECGPSTGLLHEYELKLARLISENIPSVEQFRMLGSGTEAVMGALRLARIKTGKSKIIKIGGAYHGWSDQMVYDLRIPGTKFFDAKGIPFMMHWHTQAVPPNDIDALERKMKWNRIRGGTAAVIVEPLGPESGTYPVYEQYCADIRALCDKYGALLIFDEVVTAFRVGMSGAQGYFGVTPDLTIFGKVVAGGYPGAGGIGGRAELMDGLTAGLQGGKKVKVGGTLAWVGVTTKQAPKFKNRVFCLQSADPTKNLIVGITESAGVNTEWLLQNFYKNVLDEMSKEAVYQLMEKEVKSTPEGAEYLIMTPWFLGERCPVSNTTTRSTLFNLTHQHTRGHIARANLEGIAHNLKWAIENIERDFKFKITSLKVTGGGEPK